MQAILRGKIEEQYKKPINSAKACDTLAALISDKTGRKLSSTTLRRFFGLLPSKSALSKYNLDTLAIYCDSPSYLTFCISTKSTHDLIKLPKEKIIFEIEQITQFTLNSISKKSLSNFSTTIPRHEITAQLDAFIESEFSIYPIIAPGGYGKSIALAHWVKKLNPDIYTCLFCPAALFYQLLSVKNYQSLPLNDILDTSKNIIEDYLKAHLDSDKKLIIILDGLDELSFDSTGVQELIYFLIQLLNHHAENTKIKIIISSRETTWSSNIAPLLEKFNNKRFIFSKKHILDSRYCNIPVLSNDEIIQILKLSTQKEPHTLVYSLIPWVLREMLRIPINLHLFISLFSKFSDVDSITINKLHLEYLKEIIFKSKYAEQKEDLIWNMIDTIEKPESDFSVNKTDLKRAFPIHLKRETNYYQAYNELLLDGIFLEERMENRYGIFVSKIKFKHQDFYYHLSTLNLIRKNNGIDLNLFLSVSQSHNNTDWIIFITATLFEMAYLNEDYDAIERFCELPEYILQAFLVRFSVGISFRINNKIRNALIQKFAASPVGQIYFFEQFVDTNYLYNNYDFRIKEYLKHKKSNEAKLFGNSILFLSGFLKMDVEICKQQLSIIEEIVPDSSMHPWPIGRKVAIQILHSYFIDKKQHANINHIIQSHRSKAYAFPGYLDNGLIEFELPIMIALTLTNEYHLLIDLVENAIKAYKFNTIQDEFLKLVSHNQNSLPLIFLEYAKYKLNIPSPLNLGFELEKIINNYSNTFDDFQYQILLYWFLVDYHIGNDNNDEANIYWLTAMELSRFSEYDLYIAFLLINNPNKNAVQIKQGKTMVLNSGFCIDIFLGKSAFVT